MKDNIVGKVKNIYFLGIGGIGMSALARYFKLSGFVVAGYDKTSSPLTDKMKDQEGIDINFVDEISYVSDSFLNIENTLVVYTPAIPKDNTQFNFFKEKGFTMYKRAEILGFISRRTKAVCIAGTHGKTSISTMVAYLLHHSHIGCNAFLGGISMNFGTNIILNNSSDYVVIEADEFDRSFLHLEPELALISSMDADHLDIYGNEDNIRQAFCDFASNVREGGKIFLKEGLLIPDKAVTAKYGLSKNADCYSHNIRVENGYYVFDYKFRDVEIPDLRAGVPGILNIENLTAAITVALTLGVKTDEIKSSLPDYKGVWRRFNIHVNQTNRVYIDDYAHHPTEIESSLRAIKDMWQDSTHNSITVIFQPHLYSRTNDFYKGFAKSLGIADRVVLLDIYPAREEPIEGVSSEMILKELKVQGEILCKEEIVDWVANNYIDGILVTMGAGDIDRCVEPIKSLINSYKS